MTFNPRLLQRVAAGLRARAGIRTSRAPRPTRLASSGSRTPKLLVACAWCKRVQLTTGWVEWREAVRSLGTQIDPSREFSHGICNSCYVRVASAIPHDSAMPQESSPTPADTIG